MGEVGKVGERARKVGKREETVCERRKDIGAIGMNRWKVANDDQGRGGMMMMMGRESSD